MQMRGQKEETAKTKEVKNYVKIFAYIKDYE
jgi:hypothetical protein